MQNENSAFHTVFSHRTVLCFSVMVILFFFSVVRLASLLQTDYAAAQAAQSAWRLTAGSIRGTVYDANMVPITNSDTKLYAAVSPTQKALNGMKSLLSAEEWESLKKRLSNGKPVLCEVSESIKCDGIAYAQVYTNTSDPLPALHTIGYTDYEGHGVSGLQAAYDELLYCEESVSFLYTASGDGGLLEGIEPEIQTAEFARKNGVVTTLDVNIQRLTDQAAESIETGAIVVCKPESGRILAVSSAPVYDLNHMEEALKSNDAPLLNRALCSFSVGSGFKPCVAAAGIEAGLSQFHYECRGTCEIENRMFGCHNRAGHGTVDLKSALAYSCNIFFYNFGIHTGGRAIYDKATAFGFGTSLDLGGLVSDSGNLPQASTLTYASNTANFSIGQGDLLLSPMAMLNLYNSIANNGYYTNPTLIQATLEDGRLTQTRRAAPTKAMEPATAEIIRQGLEAVFKEGTAKGLAPKNVTAAGKTATAQTGKKNGSGVEINTGWFCGFFPAEEPKYTVIVLSEDTARQERSCAEIFSSLADAIWELEIQ